MLLAIDFYGSFSIDGLFEKYLENAQPGFDQSTDEDDEASDQTSDCKRGHLKSDKHARISRPRMISDVTVRVP